MKKVLSVLVVLVMVAFAGNAMAFYNNNNNDHSHHNNYGDTYNGDTNIDNTNKNTNLNLNGNWNRNSNSNKNTNKNTNINTNSNKQAQGQAQGQMQGQGQLQLQGQTAHNEGVEQITEITIEDKVQHINPAATSMTDTKLGTATGISEVRLEGLNTLMTHKQTFTDKEAEKMYRDSTDQKLLGSVFMTKSFQTDKIRYAEGDEEFMGTVTVVATGSNSTMIGALGEALRYGMSIGATHYSIETVGRTLIQTGDSWGVGVGGGASVLTGTDGGTALAPNGGLGVGGASGTSFFAAEIVINLFFDNDMKLTKLPPRFMRTKYDGRSLK